MRKLVDFKVGRIFFQSVTVPVTSNDERITGDPASKVAELFDEDM